MARKGRTRLLHKPLRKVVDHGFNEHGAEIETLECGHVILRKQDIFAHTNAYRRRCRHCPDEFSFSKWYKLAREYALNTYGLRGVSIDSWKVHHATGDTPEAAAKYLYEQEAAYGRSHSF